MADHGTVEYATAQGNDYPAHEGTYERFVFFTFVGIIHVVTILFGLTVGGVLGHWFPAVLVFLIGTAGAAAALMSGSKAPAYVVFVICLLIFGYTALSG